MALRNSSKGIPSVICPLIPTTSAPQTPALPPPHEHVPDLFAHWSVPSKGQTPAGQVFHWLCSLMVSGTYTRAGHKGGTNQQSECLAPQTNDGCARCQAYPEGRGRLSACHGPLAPKSHRPPVSQHCPGPPSPATQDHPCPWVSQVTLLPKAPLPPCRLGPHLGEASHPEGTPAI